jgi:hypothetical protein
MITCEEFFAEFADYLENQVSPEVRQEQLPQSVSDPIIERVMARLRKDRS